MTVAGGAEPRRTGVRGVGEGERERDHEVIVRAGASAELRTPGGRRLGLEVFELSEEVGVGRKDDLPALNGEYERLEHLVLRERREYKRLDPERGKSLLEHLLDGVAEPRRIHDHARTGKLLDQLCHALDLLGPRHLVEPLKMQQRGVWPRPLNGGHCGVVAIACPVDADRDRCPAEIGQGGYKAGLHALGPKHATARIEEVRFVLHAISPFREELALDGKEIGTDERRLGARALPTPEVGFTPLSALEEPPEVFATARRAEKGEPPVGGGQHRQGDFGDEGFGHEGGLIHDDMRCALPAKGTRNMPRARPDSVLSNGNARVGRLPPFEARIRERRLPEFSNSFEENLGLGLGRREE